MAQPQPQAPPMPARSFSPQQSSPSPAPSQQSLAMPPNKRPRLSPGPPVSQPASPLPLSPYAASPGAATPNHTIPTTTTTTAASPAYQPAPVSAPLPTPVSAPVLAPTPPPLPSPIPAAHTAPIAPIAPAASAPPAPAYIAPFTNGTSTPGLNLPESQPFYPPNQPVVPSTSPAPLASTPPATQYTSATMAPISQPPPPPPAPGAMGPPSRPAERPAREYEYDATDSLAGTGIDIRAEEQALADYYAGYFARDSRTGLPANPPGSKSSFYGAGPANQPGQPAGDQNQGELAARAADTAWSEAAHRLAVSRSNEIRDPFLLLAILHRKAEKAAKENGLGLNLDLRNSPQILGKMRNPNDFSHPKVTVSTKTGPDGALVSTTGSWIPHDAYLIDQLALLSLATKQRIRTKLEDSFDVATTRQKTSHGDVPVEWADVAAPLNTALADAARDEIPLGPSVDSSSPGAAPLKRSFDVSNARSSSLGAKSAQIPATNYLASAMRDVGKEDRGVEEARRQKRQKRLNPEAAAPGTPRAGSAAPGTPGSVAPEPEAKAPTKKESKKGAAAARLAEASSTATANQTLQHLMGGFGGRKKGRQYSWMTAGASGASTPARSSNNANAPDTPSTPLAAAASGPKGLEKTLLTQEGRSRLGSLREDKEKNRNIELRDWVAALEFDGIDARAIQTAYLKLDESAK